MRVRSLRLGAIALCLAVGASFAVANVECDAERGICRKPGTAAPAPAAVEEEVAPEAPGAKAAPCGGCAGHGGCGKHGAGHGHGAGAHQQPDRETIHGMLAQHEKIQRSVREIEGGIVADTTSQDPEVAAMIRKHVAEMKACLTKGEPVRMWDPLFAALFEHHDEIALTVAEIEGGVRVTETSKKPEVVALIRQHAHRAVSEFAAEGFDRVHEVTPLPGDAKKGAAPCAAGGAKGASRP